MTLSKRAFYALFAIIIIEGYVVLSSELLAIRVTIPFIGSGTDMVSIIIAAVLLPLSFGYYFGGQYKARKNLFGKVVTIRGKLANNILIAAALLLCGLSYLPLTILMEWLIQNGITNRVIIASLYSAFFLIIPVFLLGQTIPLISNYFSREKLSQITGKILFFSTIGSFLGATFSTLVLMATIGVHYTATLNFILLAGLYFLLGRRKPIYSKIAMIAIVIAAMGFNSGAAMKSMHIVENNQYNVITVRENPSHDIRIMSLNRNSDSRYDPKTGQRHAYIDLIESQFIYSRSSDDEPLNILVIGAGGFTLGLDDPDNIYHFVDIDGSLKEVSEKYFLQKPLPPNMTFHPVSAESFIIDTKEKYDLIVMDAYQGDLTLPENLVTQNFFLRMKSLLKPNGILAANFIVNPAFADSFSRNLDATFRSVFPFVTRQVVDNYSGWDPKTYMNVIYSYNNMPEKVEVKIYTDNKNTVYYDKPNSTE